MLINIQIWVLLDFGFILLLLLQLLLKFIIKLSNLIKMKKLIAYTIEMHKQDPECIPLAIGIIVMGFIGFIVFSAIILS